MRLAVVVGVGTENARRDAEAVAGLLERDYGFQIDRLLDDAATAEAIERRLVQQLDRADAATQWLFYFAGHGWRRDGKGFLAPAGVREDDPRTYLSLAALGERCLASRCGEILVILDACHAGQALVRSEDLDDRSSPNPMERQRVRQILCAASSEACARDDGGEPGHSVFTQSLLDGLDGRAGVHDENGWVAFGSLEKYVVTEVERRLQTSHGPDQFRQKPIGGHLVGNEEQRDFVFRAVVPRVPPGTVQALRSDEAPHRLAGLARLVTDCRAQPAILPLAVTLAVAHARPGLRRGNSERLQAAKSLHWIARSWGRDEEDWPLSRKLLDASLGAALLALALEDPLPVVRDRARRALRWTSRETRARIARGLAARRSSASRSVRRRAWDALVLLPQPGRALPWNVWWRIPLSWGRLWSASCGRALVETKARRRALAWPLTAVSLLSLGLANTYYFSTWSSSRIVVRSGHPGFKAFPGVGHALVVTDYGVQQLKDPALAREEQLTGSWLALRGGAVPWASQLIEQLRPAEGGLAEWRMGNERRAFSRFRQGIEAEDTAVIPLLGYVALYSDSAARSAVELLVRALVGRETLHAPALAALAMVRAGRPAAAEAALAAVADSLGRASGAEAIARLETLEALNERDQPAGSRVPPALLSLLHAPGGNDPALRLRLARALKSLVEREPARLASMLPEVRNAILRGPAGERGAWLSILGSQAQVPPEVERAILDIQVRVLATESDPARQVPLIFSLGARLARSQGIAAPYVQVLARRLEDRNEEIRFAVARALASLPASPAQQEAVAETIAALARRARSAEMRAAAVTALAGLAHSTARETALGALIAASAEGNGLVRNASIAGLVDAGLGSPASVPRILRVLRSLQADPNLWMRWNAVQGLLLLDGAVEEDWLPAFQELMRVLSDANSSESPVLIGSFKERLPRASLAAQSRILHAVALQARSLGSRSAGGLIDLLRGLERERPELLPAVAVAMAELLGASAADPETRGRAEMELWELRNRSAASLGTALDALFVLVKGRGAFDRGAVAEGLCHLAAGHADLALRATRRLAPLAVDPDPELRAGVAAGLGVIGGFQPVALPELLPILLRGLSSAAVTDRVASARALGNVQPAKELASRVTAGLLTALSDGDPTVSRAAASALAHWGLRQAGHMRVALGPLRDRLAREADPEARIQILSTLAVLGGDDPAVAVQVVEHARGLIADRDRERRAQGALLMRDLGDHHRRSASQAIAMLGTLLRDPDDWVRRTALLSLFQIGASDAGSATRAFDAVGPLLLDPQWPSRWDSIANNLRPLVREQPVLAPRAVRLLRALLSSEFGDDARLLGAEATEALSEALHTLSRSRPDAPWSLLVSPNDTERRVACEVLARIAAEHPEKIPAMLSLLGSYRRSLYPHVRLSAAKAAEALALLQRTADVAGTPSARSWKKVLESFPSEVDLGAAVRLALDELEPAVKHV